MSATFFIIWGDPTRPDSARLDPTSFVTLQAAEEYVNLQRNLALAPELHVFILEAVEVHDGLRWRRI